MPAARSLINSRSDVQPIVDQSYLSNGQWWPLVQSAHLLPDALLDEAAFPVYKNNLSRCLTLRWRTGIFFSIVQQRLGEAQLLAAAAVAALKACI